VSLAALGLRAGERFRDDYYEELACLHPLPVTECFDRQAINRALAELSIPEERAA